VCSLVILSKYCSTKSKTLLAESFGQRLLIIFTALLPFYVEQPHDKGSALYKCPTNCCKKNLERSTDPKDWKIYGSELPQSGQFNMVLMVVFESSADLEPNQEKYNTFMKSWGKANQDNSRELTKSYPNVRTLTGEYRLREIVLK